MLWEQLGLLSNMKVRLILSILAEEGEIDFSRMIAKLKLKYSTTNQLIKRMARAEMLTYEGGQRTGWKIYPNKAFKVPTLTLDIIHEKTTGHPLLPIR